MTQLILAGVGFITWALITILIYYSTYYSSINHIESASGYMPYLIVVFLFYLGYKAYTIFITEKKELQFGFFSIIGLFLLHLLIISLFYTGFQEVQQSPFMGNMKPSSIVLFFHILTLLLYPLVLVLFSRASGFSVLSIIPDLSWKDEDMRIRVPVETSLGFLLLSSLILGLSYVFGFTLTNLAISLIITGLIGIPGFIETYKDIKSRYITLENHKHSENFIETLNPRLLSIEFGFFFFTFLLSISLINVIRPMPIGWDDLGVYMNYPKIMATTGEILQGAGLYIWQLLTGTGFLFSFNAAQAFYVNQLGGILATIAIICSLSYIFTENGKKPLISLPILLGVTYYAIPMTVFQQAKDMKLDPALMFFSVSAFTLLFSVWRSQQSEKKNMIVTAVAGVLTGLAFGVKVTSLMLLLGGFGLIAYRYLSFAGYIGFFGFFIAIFTHLGLWSRLNVNMPSDPNIITSITLISGSIGIIFSIIVPIIKSVINTSFSANSTVYIKSIKYITIGSLIVVSTYFLTKLPFFIILPLNWGLENISSMILIYAIGINITLFILLLIGCFFVLKGVSFINSKINYWILGSLVFLIGFGVALSPWLIKNVYESKSMSVNALIGGSGGTTIFDLEQFKTPEEIAKMKEESKNAMTSSGQTQNEDLGRYFGYDSGINNYLKLPANLTYQKNQSGEFTEISYIFLALVPVLLLFVASRRYIFPLFAFAIVLFMGFYYFVPGTNTLLTEFFSKITLENALGYGVILLMNIVFLTFAHITIDETESGKKLKDVLMFMGIYAFIFMISAFGIVWYGIVVYFGFFLIIGLTANRFLQYDSEEEKDENRINLKLTLAALLFIFIAVYFLRSVFPHGWNNLKSAYYNEYKYHIMTQDESIFAYRSDYISPIATLNLKNPEKIIDGVLNLPISDEIKKFIRENRGKIKISDIHGLILQLRFSNSIKSKNEAKILGDYLYAKILYPTKEEGNTGGIYRIGTFMTYLIDNNRIRYFDDSLVIQFDKYMYDSSPEVTIDRMKKLGLKYLLVDLNAATIDRDPRRDLTNRFERLLLTMRAKNLRLVDTDNKCLELALGEYKKGKLQTNTEYIDIAGTNYESYRDGTMIPRNQKLFNCHNYIISTINAGGDLSPSLEQLKKTILENNAASDPQKLGQLLSSYAGQSWFALFEITDEAVDLTQTSVNIDISGSGSSRVSGETTIN